MVGFASLFVVDIFGVRGLAFPVVALLGLAIVARPRLMGVGGLVTAFGALWTFLFARLQLTCGADAFFPDPSCATTDLTDWIVRSAAILAVGLLVSAAALRRAR